MSAYKGWFLLLDAVNSATGAHRSVFQIERGDGDTGLHHPCMLGLHRPQNPSIESLGCILYNILEDS